MKNIVIVGGGSSGWITALYAQKNYPNDNIIVIESNEIGILGVGEGTQVNVVGFMKDLGISIEDLIKNTGSTLKSGTKFTNWSKDNDFYYHPFGGEPVDHGINFEEIVTKKYDPIIDVCENNKVMFSFTKNKEMSNNLLKNLNQHFRYAVHFDAKLLAKYLSTVGVLRGIKKIEGKIISINSKENKDIESLLLENSQVIKSDFIFDCTGFSRLIIQKHFNSNWISFSERLSMKKAIPFFLEIDKENIPPYTEAIAMNYGWMWKIPLQHRYGCGYVFDSDYITKEQAYLEIEQFLGFKPLYAKPDQGLIDFNPGCFEEILKNNVLAIGLSASFVEPLEATSINNFVTTLNSFFSNKSLMFSKEQEDIDNFNKKYVKEYEKIVDFIQLHYFTNKTNTLFWSEFREKNKVSFELNYKLFLMNNLYEIKNNVVQGFTGASYKIIGKGIHLLHKEKIKTFYSSNNKKYLNLKNKKETKRFNSFLTHSQFLKYLGGLND
jgi:tryptophan halogenase